MVRNARQYTKNNAAGRLKWCGFVYDPALYYF